MEKLVDVKRSHPHAVDLYQKNIPYGTSTDISEALSRGYGELDDYGFWQYPLFFEENTLLPRCCRECAAATAGSSYSLDGFDRGYDITCNFLQTIVVSFWEHYNDDREPPTNCPLRGK